MLYIAQTAKGQQWLFSALIKPHVFIKLKKTMAL